LRRRAPPGRLFTGGQLLDAGIAAFDIFRRYIISVPLGYHHAYHILSVKVAFNISLSFTSAS